MPSTSELFSDAQTATERGDRLEDLKGRLAKAIERQARKVDGFLPAGMAAAYERPAGIQRGMGTGSAGTDRLRQLEALAERFSVMTKDLSADDQAAVSAELDALREMQADLAKDITVAIPGNLHPYDLEAPAKVLVPRFTPLRNDIARQRGVGSAREYRRILGYTNTGMGGVADQTPFFNSESDTGTPTFGSLALRRGQKISYAMDVKTANYMEMSLSDLVTWKAQFTNLGFQDSRQLSQMALLWAHLLGEEKAMLWGRGAAGSGYEGPVAAPGTITATGTSTGGTIGAGTYYVRLTSYSGQGESLPNTEVNTGALTGSANLITIAQTGTQPAGAVAYGVYVGTATGAETFQGFFPGGTIVLTSFTAGGRVVPAADTTSNANAYDGFLTALSDPNQTGYFARFDTKYAGKSIFTLGGSNNVGDLPFQDMWSSLYASVYADPEELWVGAPIRRQITDYLRAAQGSAAAYRITLSQTEAEGATIGGMVTGIVNESSPTSRIVDLRVHPYMPAGASFSRSRVLPIPDSHIGDTTVVTAVQDYMSVDWTPIQFTYDASTYWYGTLIHYAPKWNGCILGLS